MERYDPRPGRTGGGKLRPYESPCDGKIRPAPRTNGRRQAPPLREPVRWKDTTRAPDERAEASSAPTRARAMERYDRAPTNGRRQAPPLREPVRWKDTTRAPDERAEASSAPTRARAMERHESCPRTNGRRQAPPLREPVRWKDTTRAPDERAEASSAPTRARAMERHESRPRTNGRRQAPPLREPVRWKDTTRAPGRTGGDKLRPYESLPITRSVRSHNSTVGRRGAACLRPCDGTTRIAPPNERAETSSAPTRARAMERYDPRPGRMGGGKLRPYESLPITRSVRSHNSTVGRRGAACLRPCDGTTRIAPPDERAETSSAPTRTSRQEVSRSPDRQRPSRGPPCDEGPLRPTGRGETV